MVVLNQVVLHVTRELYHHLHTQVLAGAGHEQLFQLLDAVIRQPSGLDDINAGPGMRDCFKRCQATDTARTTLTHARTLQTGTPSCT